ncbi:MAG: tetratricopeptide repeat protein [Gammaproteobacteria bacterium]
MRRVLQPALLVAVLWTTGAAAIPLGPAGEDPTLLDPFVESGGPRDRVEDVVDPAGREGAEYFPDVAVLIDVGNTQEAIRRIDDMLDEYPQSGLAYELLGTAHFSAGRYDEARKAFRRATELEPGQTGPWTKLGILQMEADDLLEAEASLLRAIRIDMDNRVAHQRLGMLYEYQGRFAEAVREYRLGLEGTDNSYVGVAVPLARLLNRAGAYEATLETLAPRVPPGSSNATAQRLLATAYLQTRQPGKAEERFSAALKADPDSWEALLGVAASRRALGEPERAVPLLEEINTKRPDWAAGFVEMGETQLALGNEAAAAEAFDRAGALAGNGAYTANRMAQYYIDTDRRELAEKQFARAIESGVADANTYSRYSELLLAVGKTSEGERVLREGVEAFPDSPFLRARMGAYLAALTRYDEAVTELEAAFEMAPDSPDIVRLLTLAQERAGDAEAAALTAARLYELQPRADVAAFYAARLTAAGQDEAAARVYRDVLAADPDNPLALNNLAIILAGEGEFEEAEALARKANAQVADNPQIMDTLGSILQRRGENAAALSLLDDAVALQPGLAVAHYHRGLALSGLGRGDEAAAAFREALRLAPESEWAVDARRRLN